VLGDPARLSQVVTNLLANAVKFTAAGHVMVEGMRVDGSGRVRISVSDTGEGLTRHERQNIFQAFSQADSSVTRRFGGTGLGLAICKCLVDKMQGSIGLHSEKGVGSRFTLELPFAETPPAEDPCDTTALQGKKVMLHEAHPLSRRTLRTTLVGWGMQVFNSADHSQLLGSLCHARRELTEFDLLIVGMDPKQVGSMDLNRLFLEIREAYAGPLLFLVGSEIWQPPSIIAGCRNIAWAAKPTRRRLLYQRIGELLGAAGRFRADEPASAGRSSRRPFEGRCVLSVEDNEFNRSLLRHLLAEQGAEVVEAASGEEAIRRARTRRYDLIFMDLHMPGIDGAEAARRIRRHYAHAAPPILALSADVFAGRQSERGDRAFDEYLIKPISAETLDRVAADWLGSSSRIGSAAADPVTSRPAAGRLDELPAELQGALYAEMLQLGEAMQSALAQSAWQALREIAHQFRGLVGLYELRELTVSAHALEQALQARAFDTINDRVVDLVSRLARLPRPSGEV
jgi:two-component system sensor histidine kinase BarA